jgi:hypothetical protein
MDEASKGAWCRQSGVYPQELEQWRTAATQALADPEEAVRSSHREQKADRRRIKEGQRQTSSHCEHFVGDPQVHVDGLAQRTRYGGSAYRLRNAAPKKVRKIIYTTNAHRIKVKGESMRKTLATVDAT